MSTHRPHAQHTSGTVNPGGTTRALALSIAGAMLLLAGGAGLAGCEQRVIRARGLGSSQHQVQDPLYDPPEWEKAILGEPNPKRDRR